jgi:hypothetical protein
MSMMDFRGQLGRQLSFMERSCSAYDSGAVEDAVRIAVALRVIFHDTSKSISLLRHLGTPNPQMVSTATPFADEQLVPDVPSLYLVELKAEAPNLRCWAEPMIERNHGTHMLPFGEWWAKEVVIDLKNGFGALTRKQLVLEAANRDGGAHVDGELDSSYEKALEGAGVPIEVVFKDGKVMEAAFQYVNYASLRQIGYEVLRSRELLALAGRGLSASGQ